MISVDAACVLFYCRVLLIMIAIKPSAYQLNLSNPKIKRFDTQFKIKLVNLKIFTVLYIKKTSAISDGLEVSVHSRE